MTGDTGEAVEAGWEWGVRYPGGTTTIYRREEDARKFTDAYPDSLALLRRPVDRMSWVCAICDGYGLLDGLEPCPGNDLGACSGGTA